jgi:putative RecB family exonuclease
VEPSVRAEVSVPGLSLRGVADIYPAPSAVDQPAEPRLGEREPGFEPDPRLKAEPGAGAEPERAPRRPALSPSRAADFKQCPLLYRFRAIDRLPERPGAAQVRGTLVHAVLERLYTLPAAERVPAAARELVAPAWAQLLADDPRLSPLDREPGGDGPGGGGREDGGQEGGVQGRADPDGADPEVGALEASTPEASTPGAGAPQAAVPDDETQPDVRLAGTDALLDAYFTLEDPRLLEPEARELLVEAELRSGLLLRGYIDRVDVSPAGRISLVDYKTGTAPRPAAEMRALFQMKFYALMLLLLRGVVPAELRLMYLTGPEALTYVPDEAELRRFARTLDAMWVAIRAAGATGDFRPNTGPWCDGCAHRSLCPAWGGEPPPYPGWPDDQTAGQLDDPAVEPPHRPAAQQPGSPAAEQHDSSAEQPGSPAARRPEGNPVRQHANIADRLGGTAAELRAP